MKRKRSAPKKKNTHVFEFSPELRLEGANITVFENEGRSEERRVGKECRL